VLTVSALPKLKLIASPGVACSLRTEGNHRVREANGHAGVGVRGHRCRRAEKSGIALQLGEIDAKAGAVQRNIYVRPGGRCERDGIHIDDEGEKVGVGRRREGRGGHGHAQSRVATHTIRCAGCLRRTAAREQSYGQQEHCGENNSEVH